MGKTRRVSELTLHMEIELEMGFDRQKRCYMFKFEKKLKLEI